MSKEKKPHNHNYGPEQQAYSREVESSRISSAENQNHSSQTERLKHNAESNRESLDSAREAVEIHSTNSENIKHLDVEEEAKLAHSRSHTYITKEVKAGAYQEVLSNVRTKLSATESRFSKFIHNNTIETVSEIGAKTIARPILLLGGGVFMVFGGFILLGLSRFFGFELPVSVFLALYLIGFLVFGIVDIAVSIIRKRSLAKKSAQ